MVCDARKRTRKEAQELTAELGDVFSFRALAPKPRVRSILTVGVKRGITITAGIPSRSAW